METAKLFDVLDLLGRILLSAIFLFDAWTEITNWSGTGEYIASFGVPAILLYPTFVLHLGGGLLVLIGWWTRIAALGLALFCISTAILFHHQFGDQMEVIQFWKDLALAGGFLVLVAHGAGRYSMDRRSATYSR
jgi:putative oxidoreductase